MASRGVNHAAIDRLATGHLASPDRPASLSSLDGGRLDAWSFHDQGQGGRAEDDRRRPVAEPHSGCALDRGQVGVRPPALLACSQHALSGTAPTRLTD